MTASTKNSSLKRVIAPFWPWPAASSPMRSLKPAIAYSLCSTNTSTVARPGCPMTSFFRPMPQPSLKLASCLLLLAALGFVPLHARAAADAVVLDATALTALEQKAAAAEPRERCFLYTELLHGWTELAGRAITDGKDADALVAVQRADEDAAKLKSFLGRDSKRLKNAELLLERSSHRLADMVRVVSIDQHDALQAVLKHMNNVHDDLLAEIFAH